MSFARDDNLLRPTLTDADDIVDYNRPWNPDMLSLVAFFIGPAGGWAMLVWNFRRLGMSRRQQCWNGWAAGLVLLLIAVVSATVHVHWNDWYRDESNRLLFRIAVRAVTVIGAIVMARQQAGRFALFQYSNLPAGRLLVPAILACLAGMAAEVVLIFTFAVVLSGLSA